MFSFKQKYLWTYGVRMCLHKHQQIKISKDRTRFTVHDLEILLFLREIKVILFILRKCYDFKGGKGEKYLYLSCFKLNLNCICQKSKSDLYIYICFSKIIFRFLANIYAYINIYRPIQTTGVMVVNSVVFRFRQTLRFHNFHCRLKIKRER